jgi:DNA ligase-associated metallophosphoesterase
MNIEVAGETLTLLAERAVWWGAKRTLLVADPHFGKAASFRAAGVYVPEATTGGALSRLDTMIAATHASRIVFLGDFLHAREGRHPETLRAIAQWRARHGAVQMVLVRGNHDRRAGDPPVELGMECVDAPLRELPFAFVHAPTDMEGHYVLGGHLHPSVVMVGAGRQREQLPCFWFGKQRGVLPAFGEFTGVAEVSPEVDDRVWVVADERVVAAR